MSFTVSPGVAINEIDATTTVAAVDTRVAAIALQTNWGPMYYPQLIGSENNLVQYFGKPDSTVYENWFAASNFLAYSNSLYVTRVGNINATNVNDRPKNATAGNASSLSGTSVLVSGFLANSSNTVLQGNASATFNTELDVGDVIVINGTAVSVTAVTDANTIEVNTAIATTTNEAIYSYGKLIKNDEDFETTDSATLDDFGYFAARYPGALGNSLKVAICSSANAFENMVTVTAISGNVVTGTAMATNSVVIGKSKFVYNGVSKTITGASATTINLEGDVGFGFSKSGLSDSNNASIVWEYFNSFSYKPETSAYASERSCANDELNIVVIDEDGSISGTIGTILEKYELVSKASDAKTDDGSTNYYKDVINNNSKYIRVIGIPATNATNWNTSCATPKNFGFDLIPASYSFYNGNDGSASSNDDIITGYDLYKNDSVYDVSFLITGNHGATIVKYLIDNIAEFRKDCVVFVSPQKTNVVNKSDGNQAQLIVNYLVNDIDRSTSYGIMDGNWKYQYDKYNDINRWIPLNGDVAGICAQTDYNYSPWESPAGSIKGKIKNVIKFAWQPDESARGYLYKNNVNPCLSFPDTGPVLYGDRTMLRKASPFRSISVRRLFIVIEKAIATASKNLLFQFNDEYTRFNFKNMVEPYLKYVQAKRGIENFRVVCDETNNTSEILNNNQFVGDIYIIPNKPINFIQLNFIALASGVEFDEIIGKIV